MPRSKVAIWVYGQAQVEKGIIIDLINFCKVHPPENGKITVEAGARWKDVLKITLQENLTPPVLTDYLGLSVGGVLSVGGLGGQSHQKGIVADSISVLKVMTMDGQIKVCSKEENSELFYASLATLGQVSIILEATIQLEPAPKSCQSYSLFYNDLQSFLSAQAALNKNKACQYLEGQIVKSGINPILDSNISEEIRKEWYFVIEAVIYEGNTFLDIKNLHPVSSQSENKSYSDFIHRMKPGVKFLKSNNSWHQQHPWINLLLPDKSAFKVVNEIMDTLTLKDTGGWPVLMYPIDKSKLSCPYFKTPDDETIWLFAVLRHAEDAQTASEMIEKNRKLFEITLDNGGNMYPIGSIPLKHADWKKHYGESWKSLKKIKKENDPIILLGQGQGIFKS